MVEGCELGPNIVQEIDRAVEEESALSEYIYKYTQCTYLDSGVSSRPVVGLVLLAAISIANGASAGYRNFFSFFFFYIFITHMEPQREAMMSQSQLVTRIQRKLCTTSVGQLIGFPGCGVSE